MTNHPAARQPGELTKAMAPLGIQVAVQWYAPIMAVRNGTSGVLVQTIGRDELDLYMRRLLAACSGMKED